MHADPLDDHDVQHLALHGDGDSSALLDLAQHVHRDDVEAHHVHDAADDPDVGHAHGGVDGDDV